MEPSELTDAIIAILNEKQASDIVLLDVEEQVGYTSYFVIASGRSERHVRALAEHLQRATRNQGFRPIGVEGLTEGNWALLDYGDAVVHIFREDERSFYDLEGLWSGEANEPDEADLAAQAE